MPRNAFTIRVPASTSNLGSGFDTVSAALSLHLKVTVSPSRKTGIHWISGWDASEENILDKAIRATLKHVGAPLPNLQLAMENPIPLKRGLGSSGAAIVAGIRVVETLHGLNLSPEEAMAIAYPLEGHPDNLAASLMGGWVLSYMSQGKVKIERIPSRLDCRFVVAVPEIRVSTHGARSILPACYTLEEAVFNLQRCALLVHALHAGRKDLLMDAMQDRIHQPFRASLVPGLPRVLERSNLPQELGLSLLGISISGSGSCVVALAADHCSEIGDWMVKTFQSAGTASHFMVLGLDIKGPVVDSNPARRS